MHIAQIAPLFESVPPKHYGGTERVVSFLTEELVRAGHEVTLFASGDSTTSARLVAGSSCSLRLNATAIDQLAPQILQLESVYARADEFDVLHFHVDYLHFPLSRRCTANHLTTLHGRLDIPELAPLYHEYSEIPVISISNAQRAPLPHANWVGTIHHGLPPDLLRYEPGPGRYFAFIGRLSPEKRPDRAIEIAKRLGTHIKIAAKIDRADQVYFDSVVKPLIRQPFVEFLGEIGEHEKQELLGNALALLFPVDWPEPFGLAMIEALACGTPVIAFDHGSVTEVIDDGVTGFVVKDMEGAVHAANRVWSLSRRRCREVFEQRFTSSRMARQYVAAYERSSQRRIA